MGLRSKAKKIARKISGGSGGNIFGLGSSSSLKKLGKRLEKNIKNEAKQLEKKTKQTLNDVFKKTNTKRLTKDKYTTLRTILTATSVAVTVVGAIGAVSTAGSISGAMGNYVNSMIAAYESGGFTAIASKFGSKAAQMFIADRIDQGLRLMSQRHHNSKVTIIPEIEINDSDHQDSELDYSTNLILGELYTEANIIELIFSKFTSEQLNVIDEEDMLILLSIILESDLVRQLVNDKDINIDNIADHISTIYKVSIGDDDAINTLTNSINAYQNIHDVNLKILTLGFYIRVLLDILSIYNNYSKTHNILIRSREFMIKLLNIIFKNKFTDIIIKFDNISNLQQDSEYKEVSIGSSKYGGLVSLLRLNISRASTFSILRVGDDIYDIRLRTPVNNIYNLYTYLISRLSTGKMMTLTNIIKLIDICAFSYFPVDDDAFDAYVTNEISYINKDHDSYGSLESLINEMRTKSSIINPEEDFNKLSISADFDFVDINDKALLKDIDTLNKVITEDGKILDQLVKLINGSGLSEDAKQELLRELLKVSSKDDLASLVNKILDNMTNISDTNTRIKLLSHLAIILDRIELDGDSFNHKLLDENVIISEINRLLDEIDDDELSGEFESEDFDFDVDDDYNIVVKLKEGVPNTDDNNKRLYRIKFISTEKFNGLRPKIIALKNDSLSKARDKIKSARDKASDIVNSIPDEFHAAKDRLKNSFDKKISNVLINGAIAVGVLAGLAILINKPKRDKTKSTIKQ